MTDPTGHYTQLQSTDTGPASSGTGPVTPGAWRGRQKTTNCKVTHYTKEESIRLTATQQGRSQRGGGEREREREGGGEGGVPIGERKRGREREAGVGGGEGGGRGVDAGRHTGRYTETEIER